MLTAHTDRIHSRAAPFSLLGVRIGTRMTVVRLQGGEVLVHSPVPLDAALRSAVDALGPVAHVVCPNVYHHAFAGAWVEAYPRATVHAPRALRRKRRDLRIDRDLEDARPETFGGELVPLHVDGCMIDETLFVHPSSRTVVSSDLTENFASADHAWTRLYLKVSGLYGRPGWGRLLRPLYRDRRAARRSIDRLLEHDFDRVMLAHGEPIETGGKDAVRSTFEFLG